MNENPSLVRIRKFGRFARKTCTFLSLVLALGMAFAVFATLTGPRPGFSVTLGGLRIPGSAIDTPMLKSSIAVYCAVAMGLVLFGLWQMRTVFANLAGGSIYTRQNVQCIRRVGILWIASGLLQIVAIVWTSALLRMQVLDPGADVVAARGSANLFAPFITGTLIVLVAWIMDVGRGVSDEAETLRRDAELVV